MYVNMRITVVCHGSSQVHKHFVCEKCCIRIWYYYYFVAIIIGKCQFKMTFSFTFLLHGSLSSCGHLRQHFVHFEHKSNCNKFTNIEVCGIYLKFLLWSWGGFERAGSVASIVTVPILELPHCYLLYVVCLQNRRRYHLCARRRSANHQPYQ